MPRCKKCGKGATSDNALFRSYNFSLKDRVNYFTCKTCLGAPDPVKQEESEPERHCHGHFPSTSFMSTPPLVAPHQPGHRIAAATMASGAPPAPIAITIASGQAAANRDVKPKSQSHFDFDLLPFRIDCSFPGCQAKLDGKRDVFCLMHKQLMSGSKPRSILAEQSPSPIATVVPAVVGAAARPLPHLQPQPSLSPAPDLAFVSPQLQLPTLNPGKMMPENEHRRHIFPLRKTTTNPSRIVTQQPTPKYTTPPFVREVPASMMSSTSTATATATATAAAAAAAAGHPVTATPLPVVHSPPVSPSPSQNGEPARKRVKLTDSLGDSSESRLNEQTTTSRSSTSAPAGAPKPLMTTWSSSKSPSAVKAPDEKNKPAAVPRLSNRQPIRKMALPATVNFIIKPPRQTPSGPPPQLPTTISSKDFASNPQRKDNNSITSNNSLNQTSQAATNGFHPQSDKILSTNQRLHGVSSSPQFNGGQPATDRRSQVNGQPQPAAQPQTSGLSANWSSRAKYLQQTSSQHANQKPQVNGDKVSPKDEPQTNGPQSKERIPPGSNFQSRVIAEADVKILDSRESRTAEPQSRVDLTARPRVSSPVRTVNNRPSPPSAPSEAPPKKAKIIIKIPELSDFDMLIYSQPDARPPPPGYSQLKLKPKPPVRVPSPPQIQTVIEEDQFEDALFTPPPPAPPLKDEPVYANIDPRIHWPQHHSAEWHAKKQVEIQARGGRKANFGRAAQRMREQRQVQHVPSAEEFEASLPEKIAGNPAWVRALKRLNGIAVDDEPLGTASTGSGTANGANGLNGGGVGGVSGLLEKRVRSKLKRTGSGLSYSGSGLSYSGSGNGNGGDF